MAAAGVYTPGAGGDNLARIAPGGAGVVREDVEESGTVREGVDAELGMRRDRRDGAGESAPQLSSRAMSSSATSSLNNRSTSAAAVSVATSNSLTS